MSVCVSNYETFILYDRGKCIQIDRNNKVKKKINKYYKSRFLLKIIFLKIFNGHLSVKLEGKYVKLNY